MTPHSLHEWCVLPHGNDPADRATITEAAATRLHRVAARSTLAGRGEGGVLEHRRDGLRARGIVGVVVADGACLEILPKIDVAGEGEAATAQVRERLVHMLAIALDLDVASGAVASLGLQRENLLEVLIGLFVRQLAEAVRRGMPVRYVAQEDDLPTLRGRLDITRQFTTLAANPAQLACRFDELSPDITLNQVMKAAVTRLAQIARAPANQRSLRELGQVYAEIASVPVRLLAWDRIVLDRTNSRWRSLLALARLLLGEQFQTTSSGATDGFSLLFEMNILFERYVARVLRRALAGQGIEVVAQGGLRFCLAEVPSGRGLFQTKPDILLRRDGHVVQIIDTKWKRIARAIDDRKQGVSQGDVYQMMAYARLYDCARVTLLYPHHAALGEAPVNSAHTIRGGGLLEVATLDVAKRAAPDQWLRDLCS